MSDPLQPAGMPTTWGSSTAYGYNRSDQSNYRASASYVTGTHNIKAGFTLMHSWRYTTQEVNNSVSLQLRSLQPFQITQFATPIQFHETLKYNMGLYAQDQWTIRRLTMNYGVRADFLNAQVDAQDIQAGPFTRRPSLRCDQERAELEGYRSARRGLLRSLRQWQDRAQGQRRPLRRWRVV
jgi:hypothetical protein